MSGVFHDLTVGDARYLGSGKIEGLTPHALRPLAAEFYDRVISPVIDLPASRTINEVVLNEWQSFDFSDRLHSSIVQEMLWGASTFNIRELPIILQSWELTVPQQAAGSVFTFHLGSNNLCDVDAGYVVDSVNVLFQKLPPKAKLV